MGEEMGINARDPYELVTGAVDTAMRINQSFNQS